MAKRSFLGSMGRKRLSDITNSQSEPKFLNQAANQCPISPFTKDYVDQLLKENMQLTRFIEERDKIIELSGVEMQKLRMNFQKLQLQNWNLAQTNSHFVAELNLNREKLKSLQHELVCKDLLLKAKNLELQEKETMNCQKTHFQNGEEVIDISLCKVNNYSKPGSSSRRRRPTSCQSIGHPTKLQLVAEKETPENKRRCVRRDSARSKPQKQEPIDNLFEIQDVKFPVSQPLGNLEHEDVSTPLGSSVRKEKEKEKDQKSAPEVQRSSIGRPLRRAAEKVQSYKEIPVNVKMRRPE